MTASRPGRRDVPEPRGRYRIGSIGGALCHDYGLTAPVGVGVVLAGLTWSHLGSALPSTTAEAASLGVVAGKVALLISFVAAVVLVPRVLAWWVLRRRVGEGRRRIDADRPRPGLGSDEWWRVDPSRGDGA